MSANLKSSDKARNKAKPALFNLDDTGLTITEDDTLNDGKIFTAPPPSTKRHLSFFSLGGLFLSSLAAILTLWASLQLQSFILGLLNRDDLLGSIMLILIVIAAVTGIALILREFIGLLKLSRLKDLRLEAERAYQENDLPAARSNLKAVKILYARQPTHSWALKRVSELEREIMDGRETLEMLDRELGAHLDEQAVQIVSQTTRKIALLTAVAPGPILDMFAVGWLNLAMLRKIATTYGGRPGFFALVRLTRQVITHLALTGGLALTGDLLQPLIGQSIAAKLSKKLGEGIFNGALSARIGLAAISICRPLPHLATEPPKFKGLVRELLTLTSKEAKQ